MTELKRALGPVMLWGLGVGYVISGMYFGWNLGLPLGGTWGMLAATIVATILYVTFIFSYTELACAIPRAGGAFDFGLRRRRSRRPSAPTSTSSSRRCLRPPSPSPPMSCSPA
jgi:amino acid permease